METFGAFVKDVGFPIAVASFVLFRLNGKVASLADAMWKLTDALNRHNDRTAELIRRIEHIEDNQERKEGC